MYATQRPLYSYKPNNVRRRRCRTWPKANRKSQRRQDDHDHIRHGRPLQPAGQPRSDLGRRRLRDRARREPERRQPVLPRLLRLRSKARRRRPPAARSRASRRRTSTRSSSNSTEPQAPIVVGALVLPLRAPVPKEYAAKYDAQEAERVRQLPGRDGPVHAEVRLLRARCSAIGYQPGQVGDARAQPELEREHGPPPGLPRPDQHQHRRRPERDRAAGARRLATWSRTTRRRRRSSSSPTSSTATS